VFLLGCIVDLWLKVNIRRLEKPEILTLAVQKENIQSDGVWNCIALKLQLF
jgi:hypothetical protein